MVDTTGSNKQGGVQPMVRNEFMTLGVERETRVKTKKRVSRKDMSGGLWKARHISAHSTGACSPRVAELQLERFRLCLFVAPQQIGAHEHGERVTFSSSDLAGERKDRDLPSVRVQGYVLLLNIISILTIRL